MESETMSVQTLNPAGYNKIAECRHSLLRQAILSHQSQPTPLVARPSSTRPESSRPHTVVARRASSQVTIEEVRVFLRRGYQTFVALGVVTLLTLGLDLFLALS
jgi:hypothetical protein